MDFQGQILVGVTGVGENTCALRFALDEARARGFRVNLVHGVNLTVPPPPPGALLVDGTWREVGERIVEEVRREAESLLDGEPVALTTLVESGPPGRRLGELSRQADLVSCSTVTCRGSIASSPARPW